jgi:hypothetical protein
MNPLLLPADTSEDARRVQIEGLRRMGIAGRAAVTFDLNRTVRDVARAGIRWRHPDYTREQVEKALMRLVLGEELFRDVFPEASVRP